MSWSVTAKGRRFAAPSEIKAAFESARKQCGPGPGLRIIQIHEDAVDRVLTQAPHDCDIAIASSGHFDQTAFGSAELKVSVGAHVPPPVPKAKQAAAATKA
jgi:hypothetical protein